jgi:hypothetical protein
MPCNGDLEQDSPALYGSVRKRFAESQVRVLVGEYLEAVTAGANRELDFSRPEDASFNPRIARIASLVAHEGGMDDFSALRAVLWSCVPGRMSVALAEFPTELLEVKEAVYVERLAKTILAAAHLDRLRHIHLSSTSQELQKQVVQQTSDAMAAGLLSDVASTLETKLRHVIAMQLRRLDVQQDTE